MQVSILSGMPASPLFSLKTVCEKNGNALACTIVNANYERVMSMLTRLLRDDQLKNACGCSKCVSDMAAIALNCLPPHYYVAAGEGGESGSPWVMIENAVAEAVERVMKNPRHER